MLWIVIENNSKCIYVDERHKVPVFREREECSTVVGYTYNYEYKLKCNPGT